MLDTSKLDGRMIKKGYMTQGDNANRYDDTKEVHNMNEVSLQRDALCYMGGTGTKSSGVNRPQTRRY